MLFPVLVILPGMIAAALAVTAKDGYRLPPKPLDSAIYAKADPGGEAGRRRGPQRRRRRSSLNIALGADDVKIKLNPDKDRRPGRNKPRRSRGQDLKDAPAERRGARTTTTASSSRWCKKYCPSGLLGLALTGLLASFMSGMAGNVTAFNTVWTYDLYQAYIAPNKSDEHYMLDGPRRHGRGHPA